MWLREERFSRFLCHSLLSTTKLGGHNSAHLCIRNTKLIVSQPWQERNMMGFVEVMGRRKKKRKRRAKSLGQGVFSSRLLPGEEVAMTLRWWKVSWGWMWFRNLFPVKILRAAQWKVNNERYNVVRPTLGDSGFDIQLYTHTLFLGGIPKVPEIMSGELARKVHQRRSDMSF